MLGAAKRKVPETLASVLPSAAKSLPQGHAIIAVNPGSMLASKMVKEGVGVAGNDLNVGADILIDAAIGKRFADTSGAYFDNDSGRFSDPHPAALDARHSEDVMAAIQEFIDPTG